MRISKLATEVRLPQLGQTMEEGTIVDYKVNVGNEFKVFVPIFWICPEGVVVVGLADEEGVVGVACAAGVLGGGGGGEEKEKENQENGQSKTDD